MKTTQDRLQALLAEAGRRHVRFENCKRRRATISRAVNAAITLSALATAAAGTAATPTPVTITFAAVLVIAATANLAVTDTERDRDLHRLSDAWRRHRTDAARLLARNGVQPPADTPEKIRDETAELERRIAETRSDSLLHGLGPELPAAPAAKQDPAAPPAPVKR